MNENRTVVVLGASPNRKRFSHQAMEMLLQRKFPVIPVRPAVAEVAGVKAVASLDEIHTPVDTLTMYVGAARSSAMRAEILALGARRVVFNPGSENPALARALEEAGVEVVTGCTLVMLRNGSF